MRCEPRTLELIATTVTIKQPAVERSSRSTYVSAGFAATCSAIEPMFSGVVAPLRRCNRAAHGDTPAGYMQITFRKTLVAYTLIIVIVAALGTSMFAIRSSRQRAVIAFDHSCKSAVRFAATAVNEAVAAQDPDRLRQQLERMVEVGGLTSAGIYDASGKPIVQVRRGTVFPQSFPEVRGYNQTTGKLRSLYRQNQVRVAGPVHDHAGQFLGFLAFDFPMNQVYAGQRQLTLSTLVLTVGAILFSAVFAIALSWKVTGPVLRMIRATEQISQHRFDVRVRRTRQQELNQLANAINKMAEQLERTTVSKDYVSSVVDSMYDGLLVVDHLGIVRRSNPAAQRLFGRSEEELQNETISNLLLTLDKAPYDPMDLLIDQLPEGVDGYVVYGNGEETPVSITSAPIDEPRQDARQFVVVLKDITARKETEAALDAAIREARRASHVKSEFLANMSHELRTPMNSIIGFTKRLIGKLGGQISERHMDALVTVDRNAKHLLGLINDILDLSKIEAGKMELKRTRIDLVSVAKDVIEQTATLLDGKPLELVVDLPDKPIEMEADRVKLVQVATNLVSNAIKYSDKGTIAVTVREVVGPSGDINAELEVCDTGIGIKEDDLQQLFAKFAQLDGSPTRSVGGTGLGLYITAQYVQMHGGSIDVKSVYGEGSTFIVSLPTGRRASEAPAEGEPQTVATALPEPAPPYGVGPGVTILCVDDDADSRKLLKLTLEEQAGYHVICTDGYYGAVALAREHVPNLICLDINLQGRSGFDIKETLAGDPLTRDIPVIFVSAEAELARRRGHGDKRVLSKPIDTDLLLAAIQDTLAADIESVLVVEDDPDAMTLIRESFMDCGIKTLMASNGQEALDVLKRRTPSAVLLDLFMPVMDGFEFLRTLRANEGATRLPVVVLTSKKLSPNDRLMLEELSDCIFEKTSYSTSQVIASIIAASRSDQSGCEVANA